MCYLVQWSQTRTVRSCGMLKYEYMRFECFFHEIKVSNTTLFYRKEICWRHCHWNGERYLDVVQKRGKMKYPINIRWQACLIWNGTTTPKIRLLDDVFTLSLFRVRHTTCDGIAQTIFRECFVFVLPRVYTCSNPTSIWIRDFLISIITADYFLKSNIRWYKDKTRTMFDDSQIFYYLHLS